MIEAHDRLVGYRARKAAQVAAYFLQNADGQMDKLKLIKLLYITERESVRKRGRPMLYDEYYSLKDGPICSNALNGLNLASDEKIWSQYLKLDGNEKRLLDHLLTADDLDEISLSDRKILDEVWATYGRMKTSEIRNWTHKNCPEYTEVGEGRVPINLAKIAQAVGLDDFAEVKNREEQYRISVAMATR